MKDNQTYREDEGSANERYPNGQVKMATGHDLAPTDGANGFVGSETGPALGMKVIEGKRGTVESRSLDSIVTSSGGPQTSGADTATPGLDRMMGQDPTDEKATYKRIQNDEDLPQTFRSSRGAGDAGPAGSDEPDKEGLFDGVGDGGAKLDVQHIGVEMPQTGFTDVEGGGAPKFKHSGS